jgi:hypothetical protein
MSRFCFLVTYVGAYCEMSTVDFERSLWSHFADDRGIVLSYFGGRLEETDGFARIDVLVIVEADVDSRDLRKMFHFKVEGDRIRTGVSVKSVATCDMCIVRENICSGKDTFRNAFGDVDDGIREDVNLRENEG